jgi:hypothetical protein
VGRARRRSRAGGLTRPTTPSPGAPHGHRARGGYRMQSPWFGSWDNELRPKACRRRWRRGSSATTKYLGRRQWPGSSTPSRARLRRARRCGCGLDRGIKTLHGVQPLVRDAWATASFKKTLPQRLTQDHASITHYLAEFLLYCLRQASRVFDMRAVFESPYFAVRVIGQFGNMRREE